MSDLSNLLGSVYDSQSPDARAIPQERPASQRADTHLEHALSAAIDEAAGTQAPPPAPNVAPAPAPEAPAYQHPPQPQPQAYAPQPEPAAYAPAPAPAYAPQMSGWQLGDDDIVPGAVAKRAKKR